MPLSRIFAYVTTGLLAIGLAACDAQEETGDVTVDHLIWAVGDLDQGIAEFEEKTGVRATIGGSHPGLGTRNALASLGPRTYIEILAPDPAQDCASPLCVTVSGLEKPQFMAFMVSSRDIDGIVEKAKAAGLEVLGPSDGQRAKPDGTILRWRGLLFRGHDFADAMPTMIDWMDSPHPGSTSPEGATLRGVTVTHPEADALRATFDALGIPTAVRAGNAPALEAVISSPKGDMTIKSAGPLTLLQGE